MESLIIRALSLNLVKGSIDEVDEKVHMTWVQPRVLSVEQVGHTHALLPCEKILSDRQNACANRRLGQGSRRDRENDGREGAPDSFSLELLASPPITRKIKKRVCVTIYILHIFL